jgi:hypothetical protein
MISVTEILIENLVIFHTWELPMIGPLLQAENLKLEEKTHFSFSSSSNGSNVMMNAASKLCSTDPQTHPS